ncbi:hypothetical protein [Eubacterium oxidoreducens]|uniref:Deacetylase PdaC domain-containing protein n=1 Tax=Eubacterium oxidoreducens TaxID=1732 RepID=A0A1G6AUU2_EUBOX|nr:hypothetical protein [Eubacterium oxidoreducens]SDB12151.1 hypothetical protein SAMN02910417_00912 [Eubacterium oxidoreducens]
MKRKLVSIVVVGCMVCMLGACSNTEETDELSIRTEEYVSPLEDVVTADTTTVADETTQEEQLPVAESQTEAEGSTSETDSVDTSVQEEQEQSESSEETQEEQSLDESSQEASYDVEMETYYKANGTTITYPVISGWEDEFSQDEWNILFKKFAKQEKKIATRNKNNDVTVNWEVKTQTDDLLSLVVIYEEDLDGTARPYTYCDTYNINMQTGEKVRLKDMADVSEVATTLLDTENYTISNEDLKIKDVFSYSTKGSGSISEKQLVHDLKGFDKSKSNLLKKGGYKVYGSSFMEDDKVVLVMDVSYSMGEYVWITID